MWAVIRWSLCLSTLLNVPLLKASVIQLNSPGDFTVSTTLIDFDGLPDGTVVNNFYAAQGITFTRDDGQSVPVIDWTSLGRTTTSPDNVIATVLGSFIGGSASSSVLDLNTLFGSPMTEVGAYFGNDQFADYTRTTLEIFDAANSLLGSVVVDTNQNTSVDQFIGLRSTIPFERARFSNNGGSLSVVLDDVRFGTVPEPGSGWLLGVGALGLAGWKLRVAPSRRAAEVSTR